MTTTYAGQIAHTGDEIITEDTVAGLPTSHPARRLIGATVDWGCDYEQTRHRMLGDAVHYPGVMPDGRRVWVNRALGHHFGD